MPIILKDLFDIVQDMMKEESEKVLRRAYKDSIFFGRGICAGCSSAFASDVWVQMIRMISTSKLYGSAMISSRDINRKVLS